MDSKVSKSSSGFSKYGSAVKGAMGLAGAAVAVSVGRDMVDAFAESERVSAQTEAVIKSTGGAAGLTASQFADLATARSKLTGIDDEAIQSEENWLATFTQVQNQTGAGNDIFNQASVAIQDMATSMNQGAVPAAEQLQSATTLVGKALNDPIKGMSALVRVGVTFTAQQQDQIKALVESGHAMDAQKLILAELNKEFGGSSTADTYERRMAKVGVTLGNVQEQMGQVLAAGLEPLGQGLATAAPLLEAVAGNAGTLLEVFVAYKAVQFLPSLLLNVSSAMAGIGKGQFANTVLKGSDALAGMGKALPVVGIAVAAFTTVVSEMDKQLGEKTQEAIALGGKALDDWSKKIDDSSGKLHGWFGSILQFVPGMDAMRDSIDSQKKPLEDAAAAQQKAADETATHSRAARELDKSLLLEKSGAGGAANAANELTTAHNHAAAAALKEMRAELSLAGGLLGVEGAAMSARDADDEYQAALRKVHQMQLAGKDSGHAYAQALQDEHDAAFQAISAHQNLAASIEQYIIEQHKSGVTTDQAMAIIRRFGAAANVTGADARALAADILKILAAENLLHDKTVTITYNVQGTGAPGGKVLPTASGFQGWVDTPTTFLTAEAGEREYVSITPQSKMSMASTGGGGGGPARGPTRRQRIEEMAEAMRIALAEDRQQRRRTGARDL